jgi:hypothetical protein
MTLAEGGTMPEQDALLPGEEINCISDESNENQHEIDFLAGVQ